MAVNVQIGVRIRSIETRFPQLAIVIEEALTLLIGTKFFKQANNHLKIFDKLMLYGLLVTNFDLFHGENLVERGWMNEF